MDGTDHKQAELEHEQLLRRERRQRETAETLAAANLALAQSHDLDSILDTLLDYLGRLVPCDSSMVLLLDDESTLSVGALRGHERWSDPEVVRRVTFDPRRNRLLGEVLRERKPIVVSDTRMDARWEHVPEAEHVRCWLGVPLVIRDKAIGVYSLDRTEPGFFDDEHVRLAVSLAPAAASAVEIAHLLRDVREAAEYSQQIIASAEEGIVVLDPDHRYRVWNRSMESLSGLPAGAVIGKTYLEVFPHLADMGIHHLEERALAGETVTTPDIPGATPAGGASWVSARLSPLRNAAGAITGVISVVRDITERKRVEALRNEQSRILEGIAANAPLAQTLFAIARFVESSCPGALATILRLDEDGVHVRHGAAPGFPESFVKAIDGQAIGPAAGSWGTAMFRREAVLVTDIRQDPLWAEYRPLAALAGVVACWSTPILADDGRVLGSFALYYREPRRPDPAERQVVDIATSVAGIAIQRWRAEEALRRSAARLKAVVDGALDAVIGMDAEGRVISWNPRAEAIFGWTAADAIGRGVADLIIPPSLRDAHQAGLARFLATRQAAFPGRRIELAALRRGGAEFPVELSVVATEDSEGVVFTAFIADITERKEATRLLGESEERFRQIAENIREVFWMTDPAKQRMIYISPAYEAIWGRTRASLYENPMAFAEAIHPEDRERVLARVASQASGEYDEVYRILRPDGSLRWIHDRAFPVQGPAGKVVRVVGSAQDISELKRTEQALRENEQRYRGMLANLHLASLMLDREGRITHCNDYLLGLTGWTAEEVLGRNWFEHFLPAGPGQDAVKRVFSALLDDLPEAWHHENEILTRSGGRLLIRWNNSVLRSATGEVMGTASIGEDISEQKRMEEQLRQSQKMEAVGRLAGGVAHDFNNILNVITGYGEMLRRKKPEGDPDRRRIEQILRAADRAAGLTRQLLAFSRQQVLEPRVLEPSAVVGEMQRMLERLIGEDVELSLKAAARGRVKVDLGQLEQVVMNLVVNARDAMPRGGSLTVQTADVDLDQEYVQRREVAVQPGRYVMIGVSDTGQGMDEATQARIFEPFFTTKPEGKGTGLGLATVYGIVKQSGGYIWMYSEVGQGTVFRVYLPRVEGAAASERRREAALRRIATETVLVVEDEPAARELVAEILRLEGYSVLLAGNGQEAVEAATGAVAPIHLLLTDVVLPKLGGRAAAQRIRSIHPRIKVLYMSGYPDDEVSRHGVLEPGIVLLQKPFTPDDLTRRVGEVLDEP